MDYGFGPCAEQGSDAPGVDHSHVRGRSEMKQSFTPGNLDAISYVIV